MYDALLRNKISSLVSLPHDRKLIGCKWIFKLKKHFEDTILRFKLILVARGYDVVTSFDFNETFSSVVKLATIKVVFLLALIQGWSLRQLDSNNAFINGVLEEEVYMRQPEGFVKSGKEHLVYMLHKSLYGLKQAPRVWFNKLKSTLSTLQFVPTDLICHCYQTYMELFCLHSSVC